MAQTMRGGFAVPGPEGAVFELRETPVAAPGPGQVAVAVRAAAPIAASSFRRGAESRERAPRPPRGRVRNSRRDRGRRDGVSAWQPGDRVMGARWEATRVRRRPSASAHENPGRHVVGRRPPRSPQRLRHRARRAGDQRRRPARRGRDWSRRALGRRHGRDPDRAPHRRQPGDRDHADTGQGRRAARPRRTRGSSTRARGSGSTPSFARRAAAASTSSSIRSAARCWPTTSACSR